MRRLALTLVALVAIAAAAPADVAPELAATGSYVESGSNADPSAVSNAVSEARFAGGRLSVAVIASEPPGGATVFAENTLDEMGGTGTVFVVAPETVGWASEDDIYTGEELEKATDASLDGGSDTDVVELFVATLIGEPVGNADPGDGGGFPIGWVVLIVIVGGGAFLFWKIRSSAKKQEQRAIDAARSEVKQRLDDVANDIIDLESEVAVSEDRAVKEHYESATTAYAGALETYEASATPQQLMTTAADLDMAIWHLDCADALLDGEDLPPKPEKPKLQAPPPAPAQAADAGSPPTSTPRIPEAVYRRPQRRSSSGTGDMLMGLLIGSMAGSRRPGRAYGRSRATGRSGGRSRSSGGGRMRGGGRRR